MADTIWAHMPDTICSDCRQKGEVYFKHWGPLVPSGEIGFFCGCCMQARNEESALGQTPRPLGTQQCRRCRGLRKIFKIDRVVQGQSYGPESESHTENCPECGGSGATVTAAA